ncbi:hypothetical protein GF406_11140 [candidate division KSB1 bacterium]|nr:hypothetical protein [candidate division KSB1 bacterium]
MKRSRVYIIFLFIWMCVKPVPSLFAQQDTVRVAVPDTTITPATRKSDLDTMVTYHATIIDNYLNKRITLLTGQAEVTFKNTTLKAGQITVDWDQQLITAQGLPDSAWIYTEDHTDSSLVMRIKNAPVLIEGSQTMSGDTMIYNYNTEKGRVVRGRTEVEEGYYIGEQIKRIDDKTFYIANSSFTTCELDSAPHYHFEAKKMKMMINNRVIAKPVVMFLGRIPIAALPFAVFPTRHGRHSGVLVPRYGESQREGRFFRGLGYYWAPNDYYDARVMVDFFERSGWMFRGGMNYAVRYKLRGSLSGSLTRKNFRSYFDPTLLRQERRWDLRLNHSQEFDPNTRFSASGYFVSDNSYYRETSSNLNTRLTQELRSNATFDKRWPKHNLSLSANVSRTENLRSGNVRETLPSISFRKGQDQIFKPRRSEDRKNRRRPEPRWYHNLYYSYNSNLNNTRSKLAQNNGEFTTEQRLNINHNLALSLTSPKKFFGWLALNQNLNVQEEWFDQIQNWDYNPETERIESQKIDEFAARHTFNYSASANTKLYGLFAPGIAEVEAIRHVVTPSVSFRYTPDFTDSFWGYYQEIRDGEGNVAERDRFGGGTPMAAKNISLSVRNLFQMKWGQGEDQKKIDLFTVDFNTGFNFAAEQYKLSNLTSSWRANPARNFSLSARTTHTFYENDPVTRRRINEYIFEDGGWRQGRFARLTNISFNFSLRLQGKEKSEQPTSAVESEWGDEIPPDEMDLVPTEELSVLEEDLRRTGNRFEEENPFRDHHITWRTNLSFSFTLDKSNPAETRKTYYMDISGAELQLTRKWRINYSAHMDLLTKMISHHRFSIYRDLHCWEAQINWVPSGVAKRIYLKISIKAPMLRDIKLEKHGGRSSGLGYY